MPLYLSHSAVLLCAASKTPFQADDTYPFRLAAKNSSGAKLINRSSSVREHSSLIGHLIKTIPTGWYYYAIFNYLCQALVFIFILVRGDVSVDEFVMSLPRWKKPVGRAMMKRFAGKYDFQEACNLEAAKIIKPAIGEVPLLVVGGMRRVAEMGVAFYVINVWRPS